MSRILVTGGAGFIGSHTCIELLEKNYKIVVVDSFINSKAESINRVIEICNLSNKVLKGNLEIFEGDIRDFDFLNKIFKTFESKNQRIEGVIHFAGLKAVSESVLNPLTYWDYNIGGTITLLKVMKSFDCRTIVFSSSAAIYGSPESNYLKETTLINPVNPYGSTKHIVEQILKTLFDSDNKNWRIANLRYFNPVGAHISGLIGEDPNGIPNNIFPYLTKVAVGHFDVFQIFGKDWPTDDGTGVRDYIHVMDLANAHLLALEFLQKHDSQIINLNIGTGEGTSVLKFLKTFEKVNNLKIKYIFTDRRQGDVARLVADSSLAKKLLNWQPTRNIEDMCKDGWRWQKLNPSGY